MRDIRFRAWDKQEKRMWWNVQNAYDTLYNHTDPDSEVEAHGMNDDLSDRSFGELLESKNYEVMQFTGLKDKNGKEIYEGDILRQHKERGTIFEVVWSSEDGQWQAENQDGVDTLWRWAKVTEIIGNIYENTELLK